MRQTRDRLEAELGRTRRAETCLIRVVHALLCEGWKPVWHGKRMGPKAALLDPCSPCGGYVVLADGDPLYVSVHYYEEWATEQRRLERLGVSDETWISLLSKLASECHEARKAFASGGGAP